MNLILASQSPRRQQLLEQIGLKFTVQVADIDETMDPSKPPEEQVAEVSARKAAAIRARVGKGDVIIAADTIVVVDSTILGKPHSEEEAKAMLRRLSGRSHRVMTGVTVQKGDEVCSYTEITAIRFRKLTENEICAYAASGDPMDKAGSYGIQNAAAVFVEGMDGDYFNVMGLPLCSLTCVLRRFGVAVLGEKG